MPNDVYIGSRYVPIFDGAWDNTKSYEPLTIVEYGNNTYTSKRPVPVGTLPTNTTYWALTGNYNGQIAHLQDQIDDNTSDITALANKKLVFISDSFGTFGDDGWKQDIANELGLTLVASTQSRTGFVATDLGHDFLWLLNQVADTEDVDTVLVVGGVNDTGLSGIDTAVATFITRAKTLFPKAKIVICGPQGQQDQLTPSAQHSDDYIGVRDQMANACTANGVAYIDPHLWFNTSFREASYYTADGVHPTSAGFRLYVSRIISAFMGYPFNYNRKGGVFTSVSTRFTNHAINVSAKDEFVMVSGSLTCDSEVPVGLQQVGNINGSIAPSANLLEFTPIPIFDTSDNYKVVGAMHFSYQASPVRLLLNANFNSIVPSTHVLQFNGCMAISSVRME